MNVSDKNSRILAISGDDIRNMGGGEKTLLRLCDTLSMDILSINRPMGEIKHSDVQYPCHVMHIYTISMSMIGLNIPLGLFTVRNFRMAKEHSCLISFHSNIFSILFSILVNRLEKKPLVLFLHDPTVFDISGRKKGMYRKIQMILVRLIPDIHVELPEQANFLRDIGFRGRIHQFPLYISMNVGANELRAGEKFIILFIGRLDMKQKGIDLLAAIIRSVVSAGIDVEFHIIGSDYGGAAVVEQMERESPNRIKYLGRVAEDRLREEYAQSSLFISTSRYETLGLSVMEAMNYGIKIIAFDVPGTRSLVDGGTGVLISPFDVKLFSEAIYRSYESWMNEPEKFHIERIRRIEKFRERFEPEKTGNLIRGMLELAQKS